MRRRVMFVRLVIRAVETTVKSHTTYFFNFFPVATVRPQFTSFKLIYVQFQLQILLFHSLTTENSVEPQTDLLLGI